MTYSIEVKKSVLKALKRIPREDQIKISKAIKGLAKCPRPRNCLRMADSSYYCIRCGYYRIVYDIQDGNLIVVVLKIDHRKGVYRGK